MSGNCRKDCQIDNKHFHYSGSCDRCDCGDQVMITGSNLIVQQCLKCNLQTLIAKPQKG